MTEKAIKCVYAPSGQSVWEDEAGNHVGIIKEVRQVVEYVVELENGERRSFEKWQDAFNWLSEQA